MRQDLWPQLQVRRCFEDQHLRSVHNNGIDLLHFGCLEIYSTRTDEFVPAACECDFSPWRTLSTRLSQHPSREAFSPLGEMPDVMRGTLARQNLRYRRGAGAGAV